MNNTLFIIFHPTGLHDKILESCIDNIRKGMRKVWERYANIFYTICMLTSSHSLHTVYEHVGAPTEPPEANEERGAQLAALGTHHHFDCCMKLSSNLRSSYDTAHPEAPNQRIIIPGQQTLDMLKSDISSRGLQVSECNDYTADTLEAGRKKGVRFLGSLI
jgi:hypothetical protein